MNKDERCGLEKNTGRKYPILVCKKGAVIKLAAALIAAVVLITALLLGAPAAIARAVARKLPVCCVETDEKNVCITFDAEWSADNTQGILDILGQNGIKATFFLAGFWVDSYPDMVEKISGAGHEIGTNSDTHPHMPKLSRDQIANEITVSAGKITAVTQKPVKIFRPPFGDYNNTLIEVCESLEITAIQWDVDSLDWKGLSAAAIHEKVVNGVKPGSIVLFHNSGDNILKALPLVIQTLKMKGFSFCTVSDVLLQENFAVDRTGRQHKLK